MTEADFRVLLVAASFMAVRYGQRYVTQTLPFDFRYDVRLNQSCDDFADEEGVLYPEDNGRVVSSANESEVVSLLYRDGRCPQWIDTSVHRIGNSFTELRLLCCGRFTKVRAKLYYEDRGLGPFGVKSPDLPFRYEEGTTFKIPKCSS